jgi:hypothetical protein
LKGADPGKPVASSVSAWAFQKRYWLNPNPFFGVLVLVSKNGPIVYHVFVKRLSGICGTSVDT